MLDTGKKNACGKCEQFIRMILTVFLPCPKHHARHRGQTHTLPGLMEEKEPPLQTSSPQLGESETQ